MSPLPTPFLEHLRANGYHPRSDKHSNALGHAVVADLLARCPAMAARAAEGTFVYDLNTTIHVGITDWNVDLVSERPPNPRLRATNRSPGPRPLQSRSPSSSKPS